MSFRVPEQYRVRNSPGHATKPGDPYGVFRVPITAKRALHVLASDGGGFPGLPAEAVGWEHVSVSVAERGGVMNPKLPSWEEMCRVKALFWMPGDTVMQYHPPESRYVNQAEVLHLWRNPLIAFPCPPMYLI